MKRELMLIAAAAVMATAGAATLSPEEAMQRAFQGNSMRSKAMNVRDMRLSHTAKTVSGEAAAYIFTREGEPGFTILSANDVTAPVLGYSTSESFDAASMPPAMAWWLDQYAAQIEYAENHGMNYDANANYAPASWTSVGPLLKTKWGQDVPYNGMTPVQNNVQCPTGCVATAMAQAMNYFKYPANGEGNKSYKWGSKTLVINFEKTVFDWDNMLDFYAKDEYTDTQADAVALLMKACGYAVEMNYRADASGAQSPKIAAALKNYFRYDKNVKLHQREAYSYNDWMGMIYNNLRNCGPVIYNGNDPLAGGHSFIVDGYDGNGYFHLNWGWEGLSDGYFLLDALTPTAQGTGGAEGGFNYNQDAIIGMQKPTGEEPSVEEYPLTQYGNAEFAIVGNRINFSTTGWDLSGWVNMNPVRVRFEMGLIVENQATSEKQNIVARYGNNSSVTSLNYAYYVSDSYGTPNIDIPSLADGTYKLTIATHDLDAEDAGWLPVLTTYGYSNYAILKVSGGKCTIENVPAKLLKFESVEFDSPLYYNRNVKLKAHISNPSDLQLTACVTPQLMKNNKVQFTSETILITVDPGETIDYEWIAGFYMLNTADAYADPTVYTLNLRNQETGGSYGTFGQETMTTTTNGFTLKLDNLSVSGVTPKELTLNGKTYKNVYEVENMENFTVDFSYHVSKGYFDTAIMMGLYRRAANGVTYIPVTDALWQETPFLGTNESQSVTVPVKFTSNNPDEVYYIRVQYMKSGSMIYMNQIPVHSALAEVSEIEMEEATGAVEYYNLQGIRVAEPRAGEIVIRRSGSKVEKLVY